MKLVLSLSLTLALLGLPILWSNPQEKSPPAWIDSSLSTISSSVQQTHRWDYVMSAKIRLLLFWAGKDDVGSGYIMKGSRGSAASNVIRLVMGSDPLKAPRKINYWGSAMEIHSPLSDETTFFGFMKSSKATGISDARKEVEAGASYPFEANISKASSVEVLSHITRLNIAHNLTFRDLDVAQSEITKALSGAEWKDRRLSAERTGCLKTSAFLGVMERLIQKAAEGTKGAVPDCYVYNAHYYAITLKKASAVPAKKIKLKLKDGTSLERDYRDLVLANFETLNTESNRRTNFDLLVGTSGDLRGVPVQIHYQPYWWFQVVLDLSPSKTTVGVQGKTTP